MMRPRSIPTCTNCGSDTHTQALCPFEIEVFKTDCMPPANLAPLFAGTPKGAILSPDRLHRYFLWRIFKMPVRQAVNFIGLNPSTADERTDDHTIRRCMDYAKRWQMDALFMTNVYAFRATYPSELMKATDPIGKTNDGWLNAVAEASSLIIVCWGKCGGDRAETVLSRFHDRASHLGLNRDGTPKHPARLRSDLRPISFKQPTDV